MAAELSGTGADAQFPCTAAKLEPPAPPACPDGSARGAILECFGLAVQARVVALAAQCGSTIYPSEALAQELEGITEVALDFDREGRLREAFVGQSSGHALLDERAIALVREVMIPMPSELRGTAFTLRLPIAFRVMRVPAGDQGPGSG